MLNYLRSQLFRVTKTRALLWLTLALFLLTLGLTLVQNNLFTKGVAEAGTMDESGEGVSIRINEDTIDWLTKDKKVDLATYAAGNAASGFLSLFVAIFVSLFFAAPYRHGYIKNYLGQWPNRAPLVIGDLIVAILSVLWFTLIGILSAILSAYLIFGGDRIVPGDFSQHLAPIGVMLLILIGFASLVYFIVTATRSQAAGLTAGIVLSLGVNYVTTFIDAIGHIFDKNFTLSQYTLSGSLSAVYLDATSEALSRAAIVSVVALVLWTLLSTLMLQQRDLS